MKRQVGGTFLGLILGIVLGLGAALAVAVYVTKVPIPFVNKGQTRSVEQDAAEARKNRDWDPNAPLYGKNPARPVLPASPTPSASTPAEPASAPAVTADPLGDLARARAAAVPAASDPFTYFVQAGAYRNSEDAEGQRARLSLGGVEARVSEREQAGRTIYRVRVGPFERREDADRSMEKLEALGVEVALVRVQR